VAPKASATAGHTYPLADLTTKHSTGNSKSTRNGFLIGSDTWIEERWDSYGSIMADYRA